MLVVTEMFKGKYIGKVGINKIDAHEGDIVRSVPEISCFYDNKKISFYTDFLGIIEYHKEELKFCVRISYIDCPYLPPEIPMYKIGDYIGFGFLAKFPVKILGSIHKDNMALWRALQNIKAPNEILGDVGVWFIQE